MKLQNNITKKQKTRKSTAGFTLIELLVVIAIIGMLSSTILASLNSARAKSRHARRLSDMKQLQTVLEMYYNDHGYYPNHTASTAIDQMATDLQQYFPNNKMPEDPRFGTGVSNYHYQAKVETGDQTGKPQSYLLTGRLEVSTGQTWCWMSTSLGTISIPSNATDCK